MRKEDFVLREKKNDDGHEDYWFYVKGETQQELTCKYMEQGMARVSECVYSKDEDIVGIKRIFHFNYDVIIPENEHEMKSILTELSNENK